MKNKSIVFLSAIALFSLLFNGTMTQKPSTHGRGKPDVNCTGSLTDKSGHKYQNIENITVAGLYKQIRVYPKPIHNEKNLTKHRAYLDPVELSQIKVLSTVIYDKQSFIGLEVTRKDGTVGRYLIEANRVVRYDIPTKSGYEEREINIEAIDTITFDACKKQTHEEEKNNNND